MDLTNRSANAFMFGAWYAVSKTSTPESRIIDLNGDEKIASRSMARKRFPVRKPSSQSVRFRAICSIHPEVGCAVVPATCTRRLATPMTNAVKCLTNPLAVQASVVKKSAAGIRCACDLTNVAQLMGRSGEGLIHPFQHLGDRAASHTMIQMLQRALDPSISPTRVLPCHPDNQPADLLHHAGTADSLTRISSF